MARFVPRTITAEMAAQGYNNEGRGKMLGYIAKPDQHEETCQYRITTGGDPDKQPHEMCSCRIGLWQEQPTPVKKAKAPVKKRKRAVKRKTKKRKSK